jgi:hypothetical protein
MGTHQSQGPPPEVKGEWTDYMRLMTRLVFGINLDRNFILNMDQMLVYFLMNAMKMLDLVEKKSTFACRWTT